MLPVAILAGGLGTRLYPVTQNIPKALVEVKGEPFLAHQLRLLQERGVQRVVICASHLGEMIRDFAGDGARFGLNVDYSFDGAKLLGTAGAVRRALPLLGERFFVMYGDSYLLCDYAAVERVFAQSGKLGLMTVFRNEGRWDTSNVEFEQQRILAYDKENPIPRMRHIDYGLGAFQAAAFVQLPESEPYGLAEVYKRLLQSGELAAFEVKERFYEIGSFAGLRDLSEYLEQ